MKVNQKRPGVPSSQDPLRRITVLLIAAGLTAEQLRGFVRTPGYLVLAREVEALTTAGLTQRHAQRARGYDMTEGSTYVMAGAWLDEGRTPAEVRAVAGRGVSPPRARFLARVADAMDRQLAEQARAGAEGR